MRHSPVRMLGAAVASAIALGPAALAASAHANLRERWWETMPIENDLPPRRAIARSVSLRNALPPLHV